ncbi:MAG: hypothetical protein HXX17_08025 [Geobacteraceae bacterium]|nr:hypothetical protein [Geobacteraceae bacterium]
MGCDIHMVLERKHGNKWVGLGEVDRPVSARNYALFTELAGVRGESSTELPARGIPADASDLAAMLYEDWDGDAHTPSYVSMDEFLSAWIRVAAPEKKAKWVADKLEGQSDTKYTLLLELFSIYMDDHKEAEYRLVFWFDN